MELTKVKVGSKKKETANFPLNPAYERKAKALNKAGYKLTVEVQKNKSIVLIYSEKGGGDSLAVLPVKKHGSLGVPIESLIDTMIEATKKEE